MPVGIITNVAAVVIGGTLGCLLGGRVTERWKKLLNDLLGMSAMTMGIVLILRGKNLSPVILSLLVGGVIGEALQLEKRVNGLMVCVTEKVLKGEAMSEAHLMQIATVIVLFCFSGTGWYGALFEGMTGDGSILVTKAILDGITACIFAALLGKIVPCLGLPQLLLMLLLFFIAEPISTFITDSMTADFSAIGGIITLCAGLRMTRIKTDIKVLNLLPALPLAFLFSALWTAFIG